MWSNRDHAWQLLSLGSSACVLQLSLCAATTEVCVCYAYRNEQQPPLATTRESLCTAVKTQSSHK